MAKNLFLYRTSRHSRKSIGTMCEGVLARSNLAHNIRDCFVGTPALAGGARESALLAMTKFTRICTVEKNLLENYIRFLQDHF
ncbi:MAG: hypothetical protein A3K41_12230 [Chloroflexi bacterium RIFOXYD12_FULL_57_15]|nr:MAG: hypothetical protein A3K41_12230 [Chloroflexi bacterium RIFOXYD12_FULL_57_15]